MSIRAHPSSEQEFHKSKVNYPAIHSSEQTNGTSQNSLPKIRKIKQSLDKNLKTIFMTEKSIPSKSISSYTQRYEWLYKQVDYQKLKDSDIMEQNKKLKITIRDIDSEIDSLVNTLYPKIEKNMNKIVLNNRVKTDSSAFLTLNNGIEHRKEVQQREVRNNEFTINMYKKQYIKLKKREKYIVGFDQDLNQSKTEQLQSATVKPALLAHGRCRERLQSSINQASDSITKIKGVNRKISQRNKTLGQSIHGTDDFIQNMKRLEFQVDFQQQGKRKLQRKLESVETSLTEIYKRLFEIKGKSDSAEQYLRKVQSADKNHEEIKSRAEELKKKQRLKELAERNIQFQTQAKQLKYHSLLQKMDAITESIKKINDQTNKVESENMNLKNEVHKLQGKLEKIKMLRKQKMSSAKMGLIMLSGQVGTDFDQKSQTSLLFQQSVLQKNKKADFESPRKSEKTHSKSPIVPHKKYFYSSQIQVGEGEEPKSKTEQMSLKTINNSNEFGISSDKQKESTINFNTQQINT